MRDSCNGTAMLWAANQRAGRASDKLILVMLASYADDKKVVGISQPSMAVECEMDVKTIVLGLRRLEASGLIEVSGTGERGGKFYRLRTEGRPPPPPETGELPLVLIETRKEGGMGETKKAKVPIELPKMPSELATPEVTQAWSEWLQHRIEIKEPVTPKAAEMQFRQIRQWGTQRWVTAVQLSIANSWRGIFEPKGANGTNGASKHLAETDARRREQMARSSQVPLTTKTVVTFGKAKTNGSVDRCESTPPLPGANFKAPGEGAVA